jgi:RNA polymerase sigma-B factor
MLAPNRLRMSGNDEDTPAAERSRDDRALLRRYRNLGDEMAREELVRRLTPLVHHVANRYANSGEPLEDIIQVGMVGLVKTLDRFDLERPHSIASFAVPNIAGEIRRHFRDNGWVVHVPRDVQELAWRLPRATDRLASQLGRNPSVRELAEFMKVDEERVLEATYAGRGYRATSTDAPVPAGEQGVLDRRGELDSRYQLTEDLLAIRSSIDFLPMREREVVKMTYIDGLTQREIAERIGCSQMHVSRIHAKAIATLRERASGAV